MHRSLEGGLKKHPYWKIIEKERNSHHEIAQWPIRPAQHCLVRGRDLFTRKDRSSNLGRTFARNDLQNNGEAFLFISLIKRKRVSIIVCWRWECSFSWSEKTKSKKVLVDHLCSLSGDNEKTFQQMFWTERWERNLPGRRINLFTLKLFFSRKWSTMLKGLTRILFD